jgi:hypothetical protein
MAEALILEFKGTEEQYGGVNSALGMNMTTGEGDWPDGLVSHTGAVSGDSLIVFEVWESVAAQEAFMASRLGPALGQVGVNEPHRVEWMHVVGQYPPS